MNTQSNGYDKSDYWDSKQGNFKGEYFKVSCNAIIVVGIIIEKNPRKNAIDV